MIKNFNYINETLTIEISLWNSQVGRNDWKRFIWPYI